MKHLFLLLSAVIFICNSVYSQTVKDSILINKKEKYFYLSLSGKILTDTEFRDVLSKNEESLKLYKSSKKLVVWSYVTGFAGGFLIGYGVGNIIWGKKFNFITTGIGLGISLGSIMIHSVSKDKILKAIDIYNGGLGESVGLSRKPNIEIKLSGQATGLSLAVSI